MNNKEILRDFYGRIIGSITTEKNGDKIVRDFHGRILGKYDKRYNVTRDFYGRVVAKGDYSSGLILKSSK